MWKRRPRDNAYPPIKAQRVSAMPHVCADSFTPPIKKEACALLTALKVCFGGCLNSRSALPLNGGILLKSSLYFTLVSDIRIGF